MRQKDLQEIKTKTVENLRQLLAEKEKESTAATLEQKLGKIKNVHKVRQLKKDIALIKTILAQKLFEQRAKVKQGVKNAAT